MLVKGTLQRMVVREHTPLVVLQDTYHLDIMPVLMVVVLLVVPEVWVVLFRWLVVPFRWLVGPLVVLSVVLLVVPLVVPLRRVLEEEEEEEGERFQLGWPHNSFIFLEI
jgi:hypothetical protein